MSNQLPDLATFVAIVDQGSLRAAATSLGVKPPAVSYRLGRLETAVGAPLFLRTARSLEITEAGKLLYEKSRPALSEISAAVTEAGQAMRALRGTLRIALSKIAFQYTFADHISEFRDRHPEIELDLSFNDELVDLSEAGFHAGVRVGKLIDRDMIAVRLTGNRRVVHVASPDYLDKRGRPATPRDLLTHECIAYRFGTSSKFLEWEFQDADGVTTINLGKGITVNDTSAQIEAARLGLGIAWFGEKIVEREISNGELEVVLGAYSVERPPFYFYFPREYKELRTLRALVDFLKSSIEPAEIKKAKETD